MTGTQTIPAIQFGGPFSFGGQRFEALAEGALWWPGRAALLVADLHLEKASWFASHGQLLPPYDTMATLRALQGVMDRVHARELWCLGDSFHDNDGSRRLSDDARALLSRLTGQCDWHWITGNHDDKIFDHCGGTVEEEAVVSGIVLRHEADPQEVRPEMSGHFHPKLRLRLRGKPVSRRCFVASAHKIILPAFGSLTGGLDVTHPEIRRAVGSEAQALIAVENQLLRFPVSVKRGMTSGK